MRESRSDLLCVVVVVVVVSVPFHHPKEKHVPFHSIRAHPYIHPVFLITPPCARFLLYTVTKARKSKLPFTPKDRVRPRIFRFKAKQVPQKSIPGLAPRRPEIRLNSSLSLLSLLDCKLHHQRQMVAGEIVIWPTRDPTNVIWVNLA